MHFHVNFILFLILHWRLGVISESVERECTYSSEGVARMEWSEEPQYLMTYPHGRGTVGQYAWAPLRITTHFFNHSSIRGKPQNEVAKAWKRAKDVIDFVLQEISKIVVGVPRLQSPIYIPRPCQRAGQNTDHGTNCSQTENCSAKPVCAFVQLDQKFADACFVDNKKIYDKGQGVDNTDLVLFVSIRDCPDVAQAKACHFEPVFHRPVAGVIFICYKTLTGRVLTPIGEVRGGFMHELFHILLEPLNGQWYVDENGAKLNDTYVIVDRNWQSQMGNFRHQTILSTMPAVQDFVRNYFNCPDLEGAEVDREEIGEVVNKNNIYFAHFDQRLFPDAMMKPTAHGGVLVSNFDVIVLNSTGWYEVNTNYDAVELTKTKGKGCDYARLSCYQYMANKKFDNALIYPYCVMTASVTSSTCSPDHHVAVSCYNSRKPNVSDEFYYGNLTGKHKHLKFCPMLELRSSLAISGVWMEVQSPVCYTNDRFYGYVNKICVRAISLQNALDIAGLCYQFQCDGEKFILKHKTSTVQCNKLTSGEIMAVTNKMSIVCPNASAVVCPPLPPVTESDRPAAIGIRLSCDSFLVIFFVFFSNVLLCDCL